MNRSMLLSSLTDSSADNGMSNPALEPSRQRQFARIAWLAWLAAFAAVVFLIIRNPQNHNVCIGYAVPCFDWLHGKGLYDANMGIDGYLYAPQNALLYLPFALMGHPWGDLLWRAAGLSLLCWGLWRWSRVFWPQATPLMFAVTTLLALPPTVASLRNGQANLQIAALALLAAYELHQRRWWWATFWLVLGFVVKPIMLVMILLAAAIYPAMIFPLALGFGLMLLSPFAMQRPHYVISQYHAFFNMLKTASNPDRAFCDLRGLIWKFSGWTIPEKIYQVIQIIAALGTLGLCWIASRRWGNSGRAFFLFAFATGYLMLFNPRTESSSYVIFTPAVALPAAWLLIDLRRSLAGWTLVAIAFCLFCDGWAYSATHNWLKALVCIIYLGLLIRELFLHRPEDWVPENSPEFATAI
jgi:hypothetical protein